MSLTLREKIVLILVAQGFKNGVIGKKIGLSEKTIAAEIVSIQKKLGAFDRTNAAVLALLGNTFSEVEKRIIRERIILSWFDFEVLDCLARTKIASEIARILDRPERTVRNHVASLKTRCGI